MLVTIWLSATMSAALFAQSVVRTADPVKRGLTLTDIPRTIKVTDNVYTYEDFHAGDEKFTTTNMFVVTDQGVLVADGQGSVPETKGLVDAIARSRPSRSNSSSSAPITATTLPVMRPSPPASPTSFTRRQRRFWSAPKPHARAVAAVVGNCLPTRCSCPTGSR